MENIDENINYLNWLKNVKEIWIDCIYCEEDEVTVDNLTSLKLLERIQSASVFYELYKKGEETEEERELLQRLLARGFKIEVTKNNEDPSEDEED